MLAVAGVPVTVTFPAPTDGNASNAACSADGAAFHAMSAVVFPPKLSGNVPSSATIATANRSSGFSHEATSSTPSYIGLYAFADTTA